MRVRAGADDGVIMVVIATDKARPVFHARLKSAKPMSHKQLPAKQIIEGSAAVAASGRKQAVAHVTIDAETAEQRLDNFLFRTLKGVPKSHVYRLIRSGQVRLNKGRATAATRLAAGDVVRLPPLRRPAPAAAQRRAVPARDFELLYEDDVLLAVDKPAGVAVHGGSGVSFGVIEQLRAARPQARFLELVHRLDRGTSGILLVAKRRSALRALQQQFRERRVGKTYLALVVGQWPQSLRVIDLPLHKYRLANGERRVAAAAPSDAASQRAVTLVQVRQRWADYSLLQVRIKTGRTHQIRVHLAAQGHPVAGDEKYGQFADNRRLHKLGLKRMFLHAWQLQAEHPRSGEPLLLEAPLPANLPLPPFESS